MNITKKALVGIITGAVVLTAGATGGIYLMSQSMQGNLQTTASNTNQMGFRNDGQPPANFDTTSLKTSINSAVTSGKLTSRQAELLIAELDAMTNSRPDANDQTGTRPSGNPPTGQADSTTQTDFLQKIVDTLNTNGLNTTVSELQAAKTAATSAGIQMMGANGPGGRNGMMGSND